MVCFTDDEKTARIHVSDSDGERALKRFIDPCPALQPPEAAAIAESAPPARSRRRRPAPRIATVRVITHDPTPTVHGFDAATSYLSVLSVSTALARFEAAGEHAPPDITEPVVTDACGVLV